MNGFVAENGRTALVVGAAGGVGRAVCKRLAEDGFNLLLADAAGLDELQESMQSEGHTVQDIIQVDLRDESSIRSMTARVAAAGISVHALVIVVGVLQEAAAVQDLDASEWDRVMDVNLRGPFLVCKHLSPRIAQHSGASVVTTGSWWGYEGHAFFSAYCASKAGLRVFTQTLAAELATSGIRVNLVAPGNINTPMHHRALEAEAAERGIPVEEMRESEWAKIPLGKPADPMDIAAAVGFLTSPASAYMTGSTVDVNGGVIFR